MSLNFRLWFEDSQADAEQYFSIGHGDYSDEHGFSPDYIVWTIINGKVETTPRVRSEKNTQTHGSRWGHHITDQTYKGRYEPQTGRLTVVKPVGLRSMKEVPGYILHMLEKKFKHITNVYEF